MANTSNIAEKTELGDANAVLQAFAEEQNTNIPEKFKGKTFEDVIKSYMELEQFAGKQGQELGELRKLTDTYIKSQIEESQKRKQQYEEPATTRLHEDIPSSEDTDDPILKEARKLMEKELSPYKQELLELRREKFINKLSQKHNDFEQVVQNKEFQDWVMESPVRVELFKQADTQFDFDAANELFSTWKERTGMKQQEEKVMNEEKAAEASKNSAFSQARMETSAVDESAPTKKYRRADIIQLMRTNPDRYRALESEIMRAYAEGRVI